MNDAKKMRVSSSFKLPIALNQKMNEKIVLDGYGMRGKSKWIIEAIESFLSLINYVELVGLSDEIGQGTTTVSFRVSQALMLKIEKAIEEVRSSYPMLEGVKSKIIRASIYQRVLSNYKNVR